MSKLLRKHFEDREIKKGSGQVSAFIAVSLGILATLSALFFLFPNLLTTPDFRPLYNANVLRGMLFASVVIGIIHQKKKHGTKILPPFYPFMM